MKIKMKMIINIKMIINMNMIINIGIIINKKTQLYYLCYLPAFCDDYQYE